MLSSSASFSSGNSWRCGSRYPLVPKNSTSSGVSMVPSLLRRPGPSSTTLGRSAVPRRDGLPAYSTYLPVQARLGSGLPLFEGADDLDEELHVLDIVLGRGLDVAVAGDRGVEVLELVGVGVLQVRAEHGLPVAVPVGLLDHQRGGEVPDVRRVVLHPQLGGV